MVFRSVLPHKTHLHCRRLGRGHQYIYGHIADRHRNGIFYRGDRASHVWFAKSFRKMRPPQASFQDYMQQNDRVIFDYQWQPITFDCTTSKIVLHIDSVSQASISLRKNLNQPPLTGLSEVKFYYCPYVLCGLSTS